MTTERLMDLGRRFNPDVEISIATSVCDAYLRLMNSGAFRREKSAAYYQWFYGAGRPSVLSLARGKGGEPLGQVGVSLYTLTHGLRAALVVDMVTVPERRGSGLFGLVLHEAEKWARAQGADCLICFPNPAGARALVGTGHWRLEAEIETLECACPIFDETRAAVEGVPLAVVRTEAEVVWRFKEHPEYRYKEWSGPSGSLWTKDFVDPVSQESLTDLVSLGGVMSADGASLIAATRQEPGGAARRFTAWALPGSPDVARITRAGFHPGSQRRAFCVKWLSVDAERVAGRAQWAVTQADTEVF